MSSRGFSIVSVMAAIFLAGILAIMSKPAVDVLVARARTAEAYMNLEHIRRAQTAWAFSSTNTAGTYEQFSAHGYVGSGSSTCGASFNTLPLEGCGSLRYSYASNVSGTAFEAIAYGASDADNRIYPGCNGAGSTAYGENDGDVWRVRSGGIPERCRSIHLACNNSDPDLGCGTPMGIGSALRVGGVPGGGGSGGGTPTPTPTPSPSPTPHLWQCMLTCIGALTCTWSNGAAAGGYVYGTVTGCLSYSIQFSGYICGSPEHCANVPSECYSGSNYDCNVTEDDTTDKYWTMTCEATQSNGYHTTCTGF